MSIEVETRNVVGRVASRLNSHLDAMMRRCQKSGRP